MSDVEEEIQARVEHLLTAQPTAPAEARRLRRSFEVVARARQSRRHVAIEIEVDSEFAEAYRRPGQYVTLKVEGWPAHFFVVAHQSGPNRWEFLVDRGGELGPALEELTPGDEISVSLPEGAGFDLFEAVGRRALLFCTGSGVATMRPLVEAWLQDKEARPQEIALYYGERQVDDFAYEDLFARWEAAGVEVYRAVEQGGGEALPHRYVQDVLEVHQPSLQEAIAYLSGAPVMIKMVALRLMRNGIAPSRLKINI